MASQYDTWHYNMTHGTDIVPPSPQSGAQRGVRHRQAAHDAPPVPGVRTRLQPAGEGVPASLHAQSHGGG